MLETRMSGTEIIVPANTNKAAVSRISTFPDHKDGMKEVNR